MHCHSAQPARLRKIGYEISMSARDAKADGLLAAALGELVQRVRGTGLGGDSFCQGGFVEPAAAPRNLGVFDRVRHPKIVKWRQKSSVDP